MLTYSSPEHIGVSPVLLRLLVPRHSPCALSHLTKPTSYLPIMGMIDFITKIDVVDRFLILFSFQGTEYYLKDCSLKTEYTTIHVLVIFITVPLLSP